jgi:hypothetical protein
MQRVRMARMEVRTTRDLAQPMISIRQGVKVGAQPRPGKAQGVVIAPTVLAFATQTASGGGP